MKKLLATFILVFFISTLSRASSFILPPAPPSPDDTLSIKVPNIFSPNGDGVNDAWSIIIYDYGVAILELQTTVYDRWGVPVFQSTNINQVWLGHTPTGRTCSPGSYFYVISYINGATNEQQQLKGFVELVR
jgi:gliding motility-associated-like protein